MRVPQKAAAVRAHDAAPLRAAVADDDLRATDAAHHDVVNSFPERRRRLRFGVEIEYRRALPFVGSGAAAQRRRLAQSKSSGLRMRWLRASMRCIVLEKASSTAG